MNFNVSISSFESNIRGVRNLVNFALTSSRREPPVILYISSGSVFQSASIDRSYLISVRIFSLILGWTRSDLAPEVPLTEPDYAIGLGYGESKWVSERILEIIASKSDLKAISIRCGQMTGGKSGAWNEHEWFPSLVKSSLALQMFPESEGVSRTFLWNLAF